MSERKRKLLIPSYLKDFMCIGPACEDTCCGGWRVEVDYETYVKYNKITDNELKPVLDKCVKRNRTAKVKDSYAKILMDSHGRCPLLSSEGLCRIQQKKGEEYLSKVCLTYPRNSNCINGVIEKSLTLSCPEAARKVLLNPEGIEFDETEEAFDIRNIIKSNINAKDKANSKKPAKYLWELRIFSISVLQNRRYKLWERLIILGMFCQKAQEYVDGGRLDDIPALIASYTSIIEDGSLAESLSAIPAQYTIQMELMKEIADNRFVMDVSNKNYLNYYGQFLNGIQYLENSTVEEIGERYKAAFENYYSPFMEKHEYILENFLVNYVFKNLFPINQSSLYDSFIMLTLHYALIKLQLIGIAGFRKGLDLDTVVAVIQGFSRTVEHNTVYFKAVSQLLKDNNYTAMAYMSIIIKN